ncbi:crotonase/enoyl-CoA hydratase family protein [Jiulongibacter sp. NS-SX5]|uniref:crotonase/enoyl-CoA hydratase family protein n=1 Tax=Jiulongibacter sp. NS-SX5 TaxID=3463854 RepID=UPI004058A716
MISPSPSLDLEIRKDILLISLNRPEKRNAFNDDLLLSIEKVFDATPKNIKCIIIKGEGKHFSAGLDLSELSQRDVVQGLEHSRMWHRILEKIQFASAPVVACLHGAVVGGGLEVAAACHIRIAEKSTFYALPEGQRGIFVGGGASVRLPKLIGTARMTDMMLTGRIYSAEEGERIGLSQYLVEDGSGMEKGLEIAEKICGNAQLTNYALTHVLPRIEDASHQTGLLMESMMAAIAQDSSEAKQRLQDFLEGRAKKLGE